MKIRNAQLKGKTFNLNSYSKETLVEGVRGRRFADLMHDSRSR